MNTLLKRAILNNSRSSSPMKMMATIPEDHDSNRSISPSTNPAKIVEKPRSLPIVGATKKIKLPNNFCTNDNSRGRSYESISDHTNSSIDAKAKDNFSQTIEAIKLLCGLDIQIEGEDSSSAKIHKILQDLIFEIKLIPERLFEHLELKDIIISENHRLYSSSTDISNNIFVIEDLPTREKIQERFYKLILDRILIKNCNLKRNWRAESPNSDYVSIHKAFFTLMTCRIKCQKVFDSEILMALLMKIYPREMTEEWFEARISQREGL